MSESELPRLSPEPEIPRYTVGDVIELRVTLTHEQNLESIWVVYGREGGEENTVTFEGEVESTTQIENHVEGDRSLPRKKSTVVLRMVVDIDHRPGSYTLLHGVFRSVANFVMHLRTYASPEDRAGVFHIVEEPTSAPWADVELIEQEHENFEEDTH